MFQSILPKKKAYNKSLAQVIDACVYIQRYWRGYKLSKIRAKVKFSLAKFEAVLRFQVLYQIIRLRRERAGVNRIEVDPDEKIEEDKI